VTHDFVVFFFFFFSHRRPDRQNPFVAPTYISIDPSGEVGQDLQSSSAEAHAAARVPQPHLRDQGLLTRVFDSEVDESVGIAVCTVVEDGEPGGKATEVAAMTADASRLSKFGFGLSMNRPLSENGLTGQPRYLTPPPFFPHPTPPNVHSKYQKREPPISDLSRLAKRFLRDGLSG
jgi:hypothetical protein